MLHHQKWASQTINPGPLTARSHAFWPTLMPALEGSHAAGPIFMASLLSTVAAYRLSLASRISTYGQAYTAPHYQVELTVPEAFEGHDALLCSQLECDEVPKAPQMPGR